jgi:hypothetical protein
MPRRKHGVLGRLEDPDREQTLPGFTRVIETSGSWESEEARRDASELEGLQKKKGYERKEYTRRRRRKQPENRKPKTPEKTGATH